MKNWLAPPYFFPEMKTFIKVSLTTEWRKICLSLFNPHRLNNQAAKEAPKLPVSVDVILLKVKLALLGRTCSLLFRCVYFIRVVINKFYLDLGHISYRCYFSAALAVWAFTAGSVYRKNGSAGLLRTYRCRSSPPHKGTVCLHPSNSQKTSNQWGSHTKRSL